LGIALLGVGVLVVGGAYFEVLREVGGFLLTTGLLTALVGALRSGFSAKRKQADAQRKKVEKLRLDLNWLDELEPVLERFEQFKSKSSAELMQVQAEREALIVKVLKTAPKSLVRH
jgi:hypothetical protein